MEDTGPTTDRLGLEVLDPETCWDLIAGAAVGRLAFMDEGAPMVLPVVHAVRGRRIAFRSASGSKLAAARLGGPVAFEVDEWDVGARAGWSVVARGTAESAPEDVSDLDALELDAWVARVADGTWVEIRVDEVSGRRLRGAT